MPADANVTLLTSQTITTAGVNGPSYNTLTGTPRRGLSARILYSAVSAATAGCVMTFKQQKSSDNTTFVDSVYATPLTYSTTAQAGVLDLHMYAEKAFPYIRVVATPSPTTGLPTGVFKVEIDAAIPG